MVPESQNAAMKFAAFVTYIAIARTENCYEGSQERNAVATEIGSTPKRNDVTGEKSHASLMIRF